MQCLHILGDVPKDHFEAKRVDKTRIAIAIHMICGFVIVYYGCFLHIQKNSNLYRIIVYYMMRVTTCIHTRTVFYYIVLNVLGKKRINMPLYVGAGLINLHNEIILGFYSYLLG